MHRPGASMKLSAGASPASACLMRRVSCCLRSSTNGRISRYSWQLKGAVMPELHTLLADLVLGESPRWHAGRLWLCDWSAHEILAVDLAGKRELITTIPSFPFCIDWLPDGRLLVVSGGEGRLLAREPDGRLLVVSGGEGRL